MIDKEVFLCNRNGKKLYVNVMEQQTTAPNVIFIMTPMGTVQNFKDFYSPLSDKGCNVFALDLSGMGRSEGCMEEFSMHSIFEDINSLLDYIKKNCSEDIHLFGATGIGGILAQTYLANAKPSCGIRSFIQTGVATYGDMSIMPYSSTYKLLYKIIPFVAGKFPTASIKFRIPKFKGLNSEKETQWYLQLQKNIQERWICI